jgi:hypothetical protein
VVELIGATTTKTGLKVESALDTRTYQKGIKVRNLSRPCNPPRSLPRPRSGASRRCRHVGRLRYALRHRHLRPHDHSGL